jgi:hypothetical protein
LGFELRRAWIFSAALVGLASLHGPAQAADAPARVTLVEDPGDSNILPRLRAELLGLGLDVRTVAKKENERLPEDLVETARGTGAMAAFRIVVVGDRADVWLADQEAGQAVLRELLPRGAQMDGRVVALRAVELLRTRIMKLDLPRPDEKAVLGVATRNEKTGRFSNQLALGADLGMLWSPGGCGPAMDLVAGVTWLPSWIGARLAVGGVLFPARISRKEGSGEITTRWLALEGVLDVRHPSGPFRLRIGLGMAVLDTNVRGLANPPRLSGQGSFFSFTPVASSTVAWAFTTRSRVVLGAAYLRPLRSADILVADNTIGHFGRDILLLNLGLETELP